jgi:hypothetical protein
MDNARYDISLMALDYGSLSSYPNWNDNTDVNSDGMVSLADLLIMEQHCAR